MKKWKKVSELRKGDKLVAYDGSFHLDEITSIREVGVEPVYDLTIEKEANFLASDVISHNTRW